MKDPTKWKRPHEAILKLFTGLVAFLNPYEAVWLGEKPKQEEKILYVLNHQRSGFDVPLSGLCLPYLETGVYSRGLGDRIHFQVPLWAQIGNYLGVIDSNRKTCGQVMELGQHLVVFPGGADEVFRPSTIPTYTLLWKDRKGFAKMAVEHGYTIIPVSCRGMEDMWTVLFDFPATLLYGLFGDSKRGVGRAIPVSVPNGQFQKQYFVFGKPIRTDHFQDKSDEVVALVRDETRAAILSGLEIAKAMQEEDPHRFLDWTFLIGKRYKLNVSFKKPK
ncbi:hypothetical protein HDV03_000950 [Kappamyces sp. JEL0829]|nr:hypothetical protein HDV03_000950 [Kappamyces sp. JEL0829]